MDQLTIRNLFRLSNGVTILALDKPSSGVSWRNQRVRLTRGAGILRNPFTITGESLMFGRSANEDQVAIETSEPVDLTLEEAQSGRWRLGLSA